MTRPRASSFDAFCKDAFDFLARSRVPYLVIGGLAVLAVGEARTTGDVDVVVYASDERAERLIAEAAAAGFEVVAEVERERLRATGTLRFRRKPFQLDVILASLPFEDAALARSTKHELFGKRVPMPTPEDLILFKVLAGRDKDLLDAEGIARRHRDRLDRAYLEATLQEICDLAEDMSAYRRLEAILRKGST